VFASGAQDPAETVLAAMKRVLRARRRWDGLKNILIVAMV